MNPSIGFAGVSKSSVGSVPRYGTWAEVSIGFNALALQCVPSQSESSKEQSQKPRQRDYRIVSVIVLSVFASPRTRSEMPDDGSTATRAGKLVPV